MHSSVNDFPPGRVTCHSARAHPAVTDCSSRVNRVSFSQEYSAFFHAGAEGKRAGILNVDSVVRRGRDRNGQADGRGRALAVNAAQTVAVVVEIGARLVFEEVFAEFDEGFVEVFAGAVNVVFTQGYAGLMLNGFVRQQIGKVREGGHCEGTQCAKSAK